MEPSSKRSLEHYEATMVLAAVGDTMGYYNGRWEFNRSGQDIHNQMMEMTHNKGVRYLHITEKDWRYSDDTVMHKATAQALIHCGKKATIDELGRQLAVEYVKCWGYMGGRAPGNGTYVSVMQLKKDGSNWNELKFRKTAGGCGAAMRTACIGLVFDDLEKVIVVALQAGRITHHNPVGYLGGVLAACFTYYAIHNQHPEMWAALLLQNKVFELAQKYVRETGRDVEENCGQSWKYFVDKWEGYVKLRQLSLDSKNRKPADFKGPYGLKEREAFYKDISYSGWGGASGHDSVIIAYDALLGSLQGEQRDKGNWEELCLRAVLHGGDSDSTGTIAGAWFGALYGFEDVPKIHYEELQEYAIIRGLGRQLYETATGNSK